MTDLQRYLKSEYRDYEYQELQLAQKESRAGVWRLGLGSLCLLITMVKKIESRIRPNGNRKSR